MFNKKISTLINNCKDKNIDVVYLESLDKARERILELIPENCSAGIGNSKTLKKMNISRHLSNRGNIVYDKTLAKSKEESTELKKKALLTDWYITGTNAISVDGHIVNMDHSGNRVAAMIYGPDNVIIVAGKNKVVETLEEAIDRVRNVSAPLNAKRAGLNPPCVKLGKCIDCASKERVCNNLVIIEGQAVEGRMRVFIVNEDAGF